VGSKVSRGPLGPGGASNIERGVRVVPKQVTGAHQWMFRGSNNCNIDVRMDKGEKSEPYTCQIGGFEGSVF
jgi:hypothetical protein